MNLNHLLPHKISLALILSIWAGQYVLADSITVSETWKDNTSAGVYSTSQDTGTFNASLTIPGLSSLTADDWTNLQVTVNAPNLFTGGDGFGNLGSFSDTMADAPNFGGTVSGNGATFYFQLTDTNNNSVNAYKITFSRSGNVLTIAGQTMNPAAVQPPWSIAAWNLFDNAGVGVTFAYTNPIACEVVLQDTATTLTQYADIVRTIYLTGTNTITYDSQGSELFNIRSSGAADFILPTLTAVSPASSATVSNAFLNVQVKATDNLGVANVEFYFNGTDYGSGLFDGTNKWSMLLLLNPGANVIQTVATDVSGNTSTTNSLTMNYVNNQTNANIISFSEHWLDSSQTDSQGNLFVWNQDVGAVNSALLVPGLQAMSASTWSNLTVGVSFGGLTFNGSLGTADFLTASNAVFYTDAGYQIRLSRSGNTLIVVISTDLNPLLTDTFYGQPGTITDSEPFALSLSNAITAYAGVSKTVYISGTNIISYDISGNPLNNIQITGTADYVVPTTQIVAPVSGQKWSNAVFAVTGKAGDNIGVGTVFCSVNNSGWTAATTFNHWTNWTAQVTLTPGTNTIQVYAADVSGNVSATNSANLVYVLSAPLQVQLTGLGSVSPNYNNMLLPLGQTYSITSTPAAGFAFTNWVVSTNWIGGAIVTKTNLQFMMVSNLTLQANFIDIARPTNTIIAPTANQQWSNVLFTVAGTAKDNVAVSNVLYSLNGGAWSNAASANNWSNWTAQVTLAPGTNSLKAFAVDTTGNNSSTNALSFVYVVSDQLQLRATGLGTFSPNYSNAWLQIGKSYSITSAPTSGFKFSGWTISTNWIGGMATNNAVVQFTMVSNLTLLATFTDTNKPTLSISTPTAGQKMTNALATVIGTASDNWKVAGVWYQFNNAAWTPASTKNNWTNWTTTLSLITGTNTIKAYALDLGGNYSLTNSLGFVSGDTFRLQLFFATAQPLLSNGLTFSLQLSSNLNGHLEYSTNLINWVSWTNFKGTNSFLTFRDPVPTNSRSRLYRAVVP